MLHDPALLHCLQPGERHSCNESFTILKKILCVLFLFKYFRNIRSAVSPLWKKFIRSKVIFEQLISQYTNTFNNMLSPDCSWNFDEVNVNGGICNVSVSLKSIYKNKKQKEIKIICLWKRILFRIQNSKLPTHYLIVQIQ